MSKLSTLDLSSPGQQIACWRAPANVDYQRKLTVPHRGDPKLREKGMRPSCPHTIRTGLGRDLVISWLTMPLAMALLIGRDVLERRETEELFLMWAKKFSRSDIHEVRRTYSAQ